MNNSTKNRTFLEKVRTIFISLVIVVCFFLGIFASMIFPDTEFADIIASSVGKFFNLAEFFANNYITIIESFTVIVFIWLVYKALSIITSLFAKFRHRGGTILSLVMNALKYISVIVAFFLLLSTWGVETPTLLASAGIIAIALSFGAQSLIEDIFAGIFIIFENQFSIGDVIQIEDFRGVVKTIGIRITKFEDINGDIKIINNSDIRGAINSSNLLSQAICRIDISYSQDVEKFEAMMRENMSGISEAIPMIKKGPFYDGIEKFQDSGMTVRVVAWVNEIDRLYVIRQMNKQLKVLFDRKKIEIPYPQVVVHNAAAGTKKSATSAKAKTAPKAEKATKTAKAPTTKPVATLKTAKAAK